MLRTIQFCNHWFNPQWLQLETIKDLYKAVAYAEIFYGGKGVTMKEQFRAIDLKLKQTKKEIQGNIEKYCLTYR